MAGVHTDMAGYCSSHRRRMKRNLKKADLVPPSVLRAAPAKTIKDNLYFIYSLFQDSAHVYRKEDSHNRRQKRQ